MNSCLQRRIEAECESAGDGVLSDLRDCLELNLNQADAGDFMLCLPRLQVCLCRRLGVSGAKVLIARLSRVISDHLLRGAPSLRPEVAA